MAPPRKRRPDPDRPSPEDRADLVVTKLERFIRDHRTLSKGVSFRKWQELARSEIADQLRDVDGQHAADHRTLDRTLMVLGAALSTIGIWGTALAIDAAPDRVIAGVVTLFAGLVVLWCVGVLGLRSPLRRFRRDRAREGLTRVHTLNRKVRDLEHQLKAREKALRKQVDELPED